MNYTTKLSILLACVTLWIPARITGCSPEPRAILGQINYGGMKTGTVYITGQRPGETGILSSYTVSTGIGPYDMRVRTGTYTVSAYMDINDDFKQGADEPSGFYDGNKDGKPDKVVVRGEVSGIDLTLYDP
jgi:hypothetical protein